MTTIKETIQDNNAILAKVPNWREVFDSATKDQKAIVKAREALEGKRNAAGAGVCGQFLELAKHYPNVDNWAEAWSAMRAEYGAKRVPQVLSDAYSVIRRAMQAKVCGSSKDDSGKVTAVLGDISKAASFNELKAGLKAVKAMEAVQAKQVLSNDPFIQMLERIASEYKKGTADTKALIEQHLAGLLVRVNLETTVAPIADAATAILGDKAQAQAPKKVKAA